MVKQNLCVIIEASIDTLLIHGQCPFPNRHFPFGFEFSFSMLQVRKVEEAEGEELDERTDTLHNPNRQAPWVFVRVDDPKLLTKEQLRQYDDDDGELKVPFAKCEAWLGISHWKLVELLEVQKWEALKEALTEQLDAREYHTITFFLDENHKLRERREKAPQHGC